MTRRTPARPRVSQRAEELAPEHFVFGVADGAAEHLGLAGHGHARGHDYRPAHHLVADAALR